MGQEPSRVRYFRLYSIEKIENIEPNMEYRKKMINGQDCNLCISENGAAEWLMPPPPILWADCRAECEDM